ncbi:hypothetical protein B0H13DRAFT_1507528, partial [Mycena leptocephala]
PGPAPVQDPQTMDASAVSPEDKILMDNVREKLMQIKTETCDLCDETWFDLDVENGKCKKCRMSGDKGRKFLDINNMNPGLVPNHLPPLRQMEEIMIAPVHTLVSLYQVRG